MPDLSALQLVYRPDLNLLTARWLDDSLLPAIQAEYEAVLAAGKRHATGRWLLDLRRRPIPNADVSRWVIYDWLPRAVATMAPIRPRLAYFISPGRDEVVRNNEALYSSMQDALSPGQPYDIHLFGNEAEAVRWLLA